MRGLLLALVLVFGVGFAASCGDDAADCDGMLERYHALLGPAAVCSGGGCPLVSTATFLLCSCATLVNETNPETAELKTIAFSWKEKCGRCPLDGGACPPGP